MSIKKTKEIEKFAESLGIRQFVCLENLSSAFKGFVLDGGFYRAVYSLDEGVDFMVESGYSADTAGSVFSKIGRTASCDREGPLFLRDFSKFDGSKTYNKFCVAVAGCEGSNCLGVAQGFSFYYPDDSYLFNFDSHINSLVSSVSFNADADCIQGYRLAKCGDVFSAALRDCDERMASILLVSSISTVHESFSLLRKCKEFGYICLIVRVLSPLQKSELEIPESGITFTIERNSEGRILDLEKSIITFAGSVKNFPPPYICG